MWRRYFACVTFVDAQVGRVLDTMTAHGYKDNTIVLLWGDHGWHLGDTNSWGKMTNFGECLIQRAHKFTRSVKFTYHVSYLNMGVQE